MDVKFRLIVSNLWGMAAVAGELPAETEHITQTGDVEAPESESQVSETESMNPESMRPIEMENQQTETSNQLETESGQSAVARPDGRGNVEASVMAMSNELKPGDKIISSIGQNAEQLVQAHPGKQSEDC